MKILCLTRFYPANFAPNAGPYCYSLFSSLAKAHDIMLARPVLWRDRVRRRGAAALAVPPLGSRPTALPTYWSVPRVPWTHGASLYYSIRPTVRDIYAMFPFDVTLAAWAYPDGWAAARLGRDLGRPVVIKALGSDVYAVPELPWMRRRVVAGLRAASRVIAVSHAMKERIVGLGVDASRVVVQHNGVDGATFRPRDRAAARRKLGLDDKRGLVVYVGNLRHEKGTDLLAEAMGVVCRAGLDAMVAIVGAGPLERDVRRGLARQGLSDRALFAGARPHEEIPDWLAAADVVCLPSRREGCPNVVTEALACGRPVVAAAVGGVPELINADNGLLVPPTDAAALGGSLLTALRQRWDENRIRASVEHLSWDEAAASYAAVLETAVAEHAASAASGGIQPCSPGRVERDV